MFQEPRMPSLSSRQQPIAQLLNPSRHAGINHSSIPNLLSEDNDNQNELFLAARHIRRQYPAPLAHAEQKHILLTNLTQETVSPMLAWLYDQTDLNFQERLLRPACGLMDELIRENRILAGFERLQQRSRLLQDQNSEDISFHNEIDTSYVSRWSRTPSTGASSCSFSIYGPSRVAMRDSHNIETDLQNLGVWVVEDVALDDAEHFGYEVSEVSEVFEDDCVGYSVSYLPEVSFELESNSTDNECGVTEHDLGSEFHFRDNEPDSTSAGVSNTQENPLTGSNVMSSSSISAANVEEESATSYFESPSDVFVKYLKEASAKSHYTPRCLHTISRLTSQ
jgi:hypothetical protein